MSALFYWTGLFVWATGGLSLSLSILWYFALKAMGNAGELADYAKFSVLKRRKSNSIEGDN